jgi:hypothetical protein
LSHKSKSVNDKFEKWLNSMYGKHGKVTATSGQIHDYLGMELDYQKQGELKTNMTKHIENMLKDFPVKLGKKDVAKTLARDNLFYLGTRAKLDTKRLEIFYTFVAKGLFLCKRARPHIQQAILVLCTRVRDLNHPRLGKADESYEILEWHQGRESYPEWGQPKSGQMVCGRIVCGTSRL